jgi:hypothetical protein
MVNSCTSIVDVSSLAGVCGGRGECGRLWNLNGLFFASCSRSNLDADAFQAPDKRTEYRHIRGGLSHAKRPPRQRLRSGPQSGSNSTTTCDKRRL